MKRSTHGIRHLFVAAFMFSLIFPVAAFAAEVPSGFIAIADVEMMWADAQNFCQQQGGTLPRPDNKDSMEDRKSSVRAIQHIDGFGTIDWKKPQKWPANLPDGEYWLGAAATGQRPGVWCIKGKQGMPKIFIDVEYNPDAVKRVVCVPK